MVNFLKKFLIQRKTLVRTMMELYAKKIKLSGKVLVVGASSKEKLVGFDYDEDTTKFIFTDIDTTKEDILYLDIEKKFDIKDEEYDYILCMNVLEHIKNYDNFFNESKRVLKQNAKLIVFTPYFIPIHSHPKDFFRYSPDFYEYIPLKSILIKKIGLGNVLNTFYIFLYSSFRMIIANFLFVLFTPLLYILQKIKVIGSKNLQEDSTPLGIFAIYEK
jgi:SAM-dependent methyltransferase